MASNTIHLKKLENTKMTMKIKLTNGFKIRIFIAIKLICLASIILGSEIEIINDKK